jgi:hypothetical protein
MTWQITWVVTKETIIWTEGNPQAAFNIYHVTIELSIYPMNEVQAIS